MTDVHYARVESIHGLLAETGSGTRLLSDAQVIGDVGQPSLWRVLRSGSIQASAPVIHEGRRVGSVTLYSRAPDLGGRVLSTVWIALLGALAAGAVGLVLALRLAGRTIRPVLALAGVVREVHETGNFHRTVDVRADGEVAELITGFDTLLTSIRQRDAVIAQQVEGLESEVAARTEDLVIARDAAEQANAAKSDFLAVMSHEIRTPLNGILALSEMLAHSDLPQRQQRYAGVIAKSGQSLLSIINDILDFSKVEAGKMDLEAVEVDLLEVAEDVASLFAAKAREKRLDLAVYVDPTLWKVLGDPVRLRQIIGNLVNNAIKFTEIGGVSIEVEAHRGDVRIAVRDTGPGIPADRLPALFDAFTQADQTTTRKHGGTGLGLAICDRLVRSMGGRWELESTVGAGSTFAFRAPLQPVGDAVGLPAGPASLCIRDLVGQTGEALRRYVEATGTVVDDAATAGFTRPNSAQPALSVIVCGDEDEAADMRRSTSDLCVLVKPLRRAEVFLVLEQMGRGEAPRLEDTTAVDASLQTFPGARVLVVDDSEVNREVATEALSRLGVAVDTAEDGFRAIERLRAKTYDMVLMDGSMPELDGFEATRRVRTEERETGRARTPIVALTAHVVGAGAQAWRDCDMDGVIHKPFTLRDLTRELARHCSTFGTSAPTPVSGSSVATLDAGLLDPVVRGELTAMMASGRTEFVQRIHHLYAENAPARLAEVETASRERDLSAAARAAHALRSMSLSLGASAVAVAAQAVELAAQGGDLAPSLVEKLAVLVPKTLQLFDQEIAPATPPRTIAEELEQAIGDGELTLAYQRLVDRTGLSTGKAEALVRWTGADGGRSPAEFIPRLEAEGGIERLTDWVLTKALQDTAEMDLRVAVNVSASEFQRAGFADRVERALKATAVRPDQLEIEVTETALLDVAAASRTLSELQGRGVSVALDDFGSGFTSLHALRELPFNTLKIDQSFIERCCSDTASAAILHAVIGVGRALGMTVVCEGVETAAQAEFLRVAGAHLMQGYHFHRPVPLADLQASLAKAA